MVSHLPTYRGFARGGNWLLIIDDYCISRATLLKTFLLKKKKEKYFISPLLPIFLKNPKQ